MENYAFTRGNMCTSLGLLTATGAVTTHDTTVTITYSINGVGATKTAITTGATPTTDYVSGAAITLVANQARCVVWGLISGGTVKVLAGPVKAWDGSSQVELPDPYIPDTFVPFARQALKAASTAVGTVTFGTTNWNATGFTNAIENLLFMPDRPKLITVA